MTAEEHGLFIGFRRVNGESILAFRAVGKLTHADYETITPLLDSALAGVKDKSVNALFDITEFEGWQLHAAWDDFKLGLKYSNQFNKIALYGKHPWQSAVAKVGSWFISGEIRYFETLPEAQEWLFK